MMQFFHRALLLSCIIFAAPPCTANDRWKLFIRTEDANAVSSCVVLTAARLFNSGNRIGVICYECGRRESEFIRSLTRNRTTVVSDSPLPIKSERWASYVVFATETFAESRRGLLREDGGLQSAMQYLFVSPAGEETTTAFAADLWRAGFRDIAFLRHSGRRGTVLVPATTDLGTVALRSVGRCSPRGNSLDRVPSFSSDFYRFCPRKPCTLLLGVVADDTVQFWRSEDTLKMSDTDGYESMGSMLINHFASSYGIEPRYENLNLSWPAAAEKLINGELDIVVAPTPRDLEILEGLTVICWYRQRTLTFAAQVRRRNRDHPVLQLLTPLHYSVWVCAIMMLLLYVLLLGALRRLAGLGLIAERLDFEQIYEIMLGQGVTLPMKTSLRTVLGLWIIFSLNLNIIYNSTFTSSLADLNTEDLLRNLRELRDSGMSLCGPPIVQYFLNNSDDPVMADLSNRYTVMKRAEQAFDAIMAGNTMGVVQHSTVDRMNWATRTDRDLRIYTMPEPVLKFPLYFYTRMQHPYRSAFKRSVIEYRESGLLLRWIKFYIIDENKEIAASAMSEDLDSGILGMQNLGPVFNLFFACEAISVLIFLIELFKIHYLGVQRHTRGV